MKVEEFISTYSVDRYGTNSLKWDALDVRFGDKDLIAMWVADMDFKTPEVIREAMKARIDHGAFGYSCVPDSYYKAVIDWQKNQHGYEFKKEWMRFAPGVVQAIYWFVNCFTKPEESVLIVTPVYYPFHNAVKDNNRKLITSELINDNGHYSIDFERLEKDVADNDVKMVIWCSPHNPVGRVWTEDEMDKAFAIFEKYGVLIISDEIHQDIIVGDNRQIPAAIVSGGKYAQNIVTVTAPSKTFNLATLLNSHIIIENDEIRAKYDAYAKTVNQIEVNVMGLTACEAAYNYGLDWLKCLRQVIKTNFEYMRSRLNKEAPKIVVTPLEGTYLTWLDLRAYVSPEDVKAFIQDKCRIAVDFGEWFSKECKGFIRLNMATNPKYVEIAVNNIINEINKL